MRITNFGSCCIDNVYSVPRFVVPGETLPASGYEVHAGGKGLNQSLALARAGANVRHAGKIGEDGVWMRQLLDDAGVDTSLIEVIDAPSGHANIQVTPSGDNAIVIFGGANRKIEARDVETVLADTKPGEFLLIQNEISALPELIDRAHAHEQRIVFNAAPITDDVIELPLDKIEMFVVNEVEGEALTGESRPEAIVDAMTRKFPGSKTILTLGEEGAIYQDADTRLKQSAFPVTPVDTTGAGDTFVGYFLATWLNEADIARCLERACRAAAICTTRRGAASSIPDGSEVEG
ncbi:MAG: ribokinase [Pseudomonadales bacterium]|nr:ribokinase [Pseudomonadales bacterium]